MARSPVTATAALAAPPVDAAALTSVPVTAIATEAKSNDNLHRSLLPWWVASLGLLFAGMVAADKFSLLVNSRGTLLVFLCLPLMYLLWYIDETHTKLQAERQAALERASKSEQRCEELARELATAQSTQKANNDARSAFLVRDGCCLPFSHGDRVQVQVVERVAQLDNTLQGADPFSLIIISVSFIVFHGIFDWMR